MRTLIVEDDFTSRIVLQTFLSRYGECHVAVNGLEALDAYVLSVHHGHPYDLICLDIMMPEMDGQTALNRIREHEEAAGTLWEDRVRVVMTTALDGVKDVVTAFRGLCDAYITKPIDGSALRGQLKNLGLIV